MKNRRLGKRPARHDARTLRLSKYLGSLPAPPDAVNWGGIVTAWPMYANDRIGDCAIAGPAHLIQLWTADASRELALSDSDVLAAYSAIGGYRPGDESTDNGCVLLDVLKAWRSAGIGGRTLEAFAAVDPANATEVRQGIWLFGGLDIGLNLPQSAMDQVDAGEPWALVPGSPSVGGHCVVLTAYDADGLTCITWGAAQRMTWEFFREYCDEAYACLSRDWIAPSAIAPSGFDLAQLAADLRSL